jgi:ubiquinone/menaquinone biosynthesis C-methylase UbiE
VKILFRQVKLIRKGLFRVINYLGGYRFLGVGAANFSSRDDWVHQVLSHLPPGSSLLDAGAGEQQFRKYCKHLVYYSQDNIAYDGKGDGVGAHVKSWDYGKTDYICDIIDMPIEPESLDSVLCTEVFEHLPDPVKALEEITRVLKSGGKIILTAPFCSLTHFSPYFYSTGFSQQWYLFHLGRLGYEEIKLEANGNFFEYLAQELRRLPSMSIEYAGKKQGIVARLSLLSLLLFLQKCSKRDTVSAEFLCFGWHVTAVKKKP